MTSLPDIITRLREVEEGSRELDTLIARLVGWVPDVIDPAAWADDYKEPPEWWFTSGFKMPYYTTSLDAAVALCARLLPADEKADHYKSEIRLQISDFVSNAIIDLDTFSGERAFSATASTPALALCIAILTAYQQEQGK